MQTPGTKPKYIFWLTLSFIFLIGISARLALFYQTHFVYEDAYITYRYAENLAQGSGFVYNQGERVLGTTTPLYTLVLAVAQLIGIPVLVTGLWLNLLADAAVVILIYLFLQNAVSEQFALLAGIWIALSPPNVEWSISGMETGFVTFLSFAILYAYWKKRYVALAVLSALLILLRIDGAVLLLVIAGHFLFTERHIPWKVLLIFGLIVIPWFIFSTLYFGSPIPNSIGAKFVLYGSHQNLIWPNFWLITGKFIGRAGLMSNVLAVAAIAGIGTAVVKARHLVPMLLWFFSYYGLFILSKTVIFPWYLIPPLPVWTLMAVLGLAQAASWFTLAFLKNLSPRPRDWLYSLATLLLSFAALVPLSGRFSEVASIQSYEDTIRKPLGLWLKNNTSSQATVYLEPIGYIGYYSQRYIYDDAGLISPQLIPFNQEAPGLQQFLKKIQAVEPDYVVVRKAEREFMKTAPYLQENYKEIKVFEFPQNVNQDDSSILNLYLYKKVAIER